MSDPIAALIDRRAAEFAAEIAALANRAREATERRFAFLNRSNAQRRRFARARRGR